jgi:hypothetical protein
MLNTHAFIQFLEQQANMCVKRSLASEHTELALKYSILADLYQTLAGAASVLTAGHTHQLSTPYPDLESTDERITDNAKP